MSNLEIIRKAHCCEKPEVRTLDYRTFITDVPSGKDCIYVKVKKKRKSSFNSDNSLTINWRDGYCVLMNLKYGTLRQIPGDTQVTPLKPTLTVCPLPPERYCEVLKEQYTRN